MPIQKQKLLILQQILLAETDEDHGLTLEQLAQELARRGVTAERKSLYSDLETLRDCGVDVVRVRREGRTLYFVGERDFQLPELKLLVDAVQSSKFITRNKSEQLIHKLERLTSRHLAKQLQRSVYVCGRVKTTNERIYLNVDAIHTAIAKKKKIAFRYFKYDLARRKVPQNRGEEYVVSPYALSWGEDNYYLICHYPKYGVTNFRVDRMSQIRVLGEEALSSREAAGGGELDLSLYSLRTFGMYNGPLRELEVQFSDNLAEVVLDRFGEDVFLEDRGDGSFTATLRVKVSPIFFGWLMNFGVQAKILAPGDVAEEYGRAAAAVAELYGHPHPPRRSAVG
ncbi:MAG: WYL domain-containing protein [Angelakisella sp.]|jgi:predicted DNA-binding transcriptional regulator YafY|nr:WYL domain-containing protein [Angelakisella sp.]